MRQKLIIHAGLPRPLADHLTALAARMGINCADYNEWQAQTKDSQALTVMFLTPNCQKCATDIPKLRKEIADFLAIAIWTNSTDNPQDPNSILSHCDDVLYDNLNISALQKRIDFYFQQLKKNKETPQQQHELARKNVKLTHQIAHLQKQLSQRDSNLQTREKVLDKINHISHLSRQINCLDIDRIASICTDQVPALISARFASLYTYDPDKHVLHLMRHNHPYAIDRLVVLEEHSNSPMDKAIRQSKLLLLKDFAEIEKDGKAPVRRKNKNNYQSNSCIIAPLFGSGRIVGIINLADKIDAPCFDAENDLSPVQLLCDIIGSSLANIQMYEDANRRARTDSMTGLVNHRTFYDELDREVHRVRRYETDLTLIMVDMDNLKKINDNYGHRAGDAVILHVSQQIQNCIRHSDIAARYGGDEFAVILPNTGLPEALTVAERLGATVSEKPVKFEKQDINVSVSVGMGQFRTNSSLEQFMNEADAALFEAKNSGKNRIQVFEPAHNPV